ncbi:MAG: magnesium/cobalt transporter CorA [Thermoleophilia bacterium]|nr:magnesium/cobalt transporter CorA [Thermoleophilia bacterium]
MTEHSGSRSSDLQPEGQIPGAEGLARLAGRHVTMVDADRVREEPNWDEVRHRLDDGRFFWLDIHEPSPEDVETLEGLLDLHPLVVEDLLAFGQRPKGEGYGDHALVVAYGASSDDDGLVEVHSIVGATWLVTLHRDDCLAFPRLFHRMAAGQGRRPAVAGGALYRVLDALTDSFFEPLEALNDRVDELQSEIIDAPERGSMQEVMAAKQQLINVRRVVAPQRDLLAQLAAGTIELPGVDDAKRRYYRDVYDHMIRLADMVDTLRDLLTGVLEVYLAMVANRRDQVMKQLTLIATIFMPLTFITGFFGQNFGWMVGHVGSWTAFALATVFQLATVAGALMVFKRRGWL